MTRARERPAFWRWLPRPESSPGRQLWWWPSWKRLWSWRGLMVIYQAPVRGDLSIWDGKLTTDRCGCRVPVVARSLPWRALRSCFFIVSWQALENSAVCLDLAKMAGLAKQWKGLVSSAGEGGWGGEHSSWWLERVAQVFGMFSLQCRQQKAFCLEHLVLSFFTVAFQDSVVFCFDICYTIKRYLS